MVVNLDVKTAAPSASRLQMRIAPGAYLTDEDNLYRCVSAELTGDPEGTALLEDCRTLATFVLPLVELDRSSLRFVRS